MSAANHHLGVPCAAILAGSLACTPTSAAALTEAAPAYRFNAAYTGELWRNTHGGLRTGTRFLGNLDLQLEIDGEAAWGRPGVKVFAYALYTNGHSVSGDLVGDAQAVSNIEAPEVVRLYELWGEWSFGAESSHSLRFGLYDLNTEFDASEAAALFVNSSHGIGPQIAQTGLNGPSIFPVTSLAARLKWGLNRAWTLQFAALDGVPGEPERPTSNTVRLDGDDGLLLVAEAIRRGPRLSQLSFGAWSYTSEFDDLLRTDANGVPLARHGNHGVYALAEARLWSPRPDAGLDVYGRWGTARGSFNRFDEFFGAGVVLTGVTEARPDDQLGLGITVPGNGSEYRDALAQQGVETDEREYAIELTYRAPIGEYFALQPVLQYVVNPDTDPTRDDAFAVALRFELSRAYDF
jgi:porin